MNESARKLTRLWYAVAYSAVVFAAAVWGYLEFVLPDTAQQAFVLPEGFFWPVAIPLATIGVGLSFFVNRYALEPGRIATMPLQQGDDGPVEKRVQLRVQTAMFIALGPVDAVPIVLIGYALASNLTEPLPLAIGYALVVGRLMQPDFGRLLDETTKAFARA